MFISIDVPLMFNKTNVKCLSKEALNSLILRGSEAWISNTIDWEYSSNLSLMLISSYVEYETGNIHTVGIQLTNGLSVTGNIQLPDFY